jgi:hypothetical protein
MFAFLGVSLHNIPFPAGVGGWLLGRARETALMEFYADVL